MKNIISRMVSPGEFVVVNNLYQHFHHKVTLDITTQIALMLAKGNDFFGFNILEEINILIISSEQHNSSSFFENLILQTGVNENLKKYETKIHILNIDLESLIDENYIKQLSDYIKNSKFNVLFWNNINNIQEFFNYHFKNRDNFENPLEHSLYLIKKISGMKTKFISHTYSYILDRENFQKVNELSTASISLYHNNIIEGYQINFENNKNHSKSLLKLQFDEDINLFKFKSIEIFENGVSISENIFEDPLNPIL